jgi:hypothetical protein
MSESRAKDQMRELHSRLCGTPVLAPTLHDGKDVKAKCVICGNFNRFWHIIDACNFCQSCVSTALSEAANMNDNRTSNERDGLLESLSRVQHSMGEYSLLGERVSDIAAKAIAEIERLRAVLREATDFVDQHSESWYRSGQELLATCRAALGDAQQVETEKNDG